MALPRARILGVLGRVEIVDALPHLNERSVRLHLMSRDAETLKLADASATYELGTVPPSQTIHAAIVESEGQYVAECLEIAIVTQGTTLDETVAHLRDAIDLYIADGNPAAVDATRHPRLLVALDVATGCEKRS